MAQNFPDSQWLSSEKKPRLWTPGKSGNSYGKFSPQIFCRRVLTLGVMCFQGLPARIGTLGGDPQWAALSQSWEKEPRFFSEPMCPPCSAFPPSLGRAHRCRKRPRVLHAVLRVG